MTTRAELKRRHIIAVTDAQFDAMIAYVQATGTLAETIKTQDVSSPAVREAEQLVRIAFKNMRLLNDYKPSQHKEVIRTDVLFTD